MLSPEDVAKKAMTRIKALADPEKAIQGQRYFKEQVSIYGLSAEEIRRIAADLYEEVRRDWTLQQATELCEILLPNKYAEAKGVATAIFLRYNRDFGRPVFAQVKRWLARNYCDNWAAVDSLCPDSLGVLLEKHPVLIRQIMGWTSSPNRWVKRASAVSFIRLARRGKNLEAVYQVAKRLMAVEDDLIEKANGWLLREAGKTDMARLEKFLRRHGATVPRTTLRYAIERFPEAKRKQLLTQTRG